MIYFPESRKANRQGQRTMSAYLNAVAIHPRLFSCRDLGHIGLGMVALRRNPING